MLFLSEAFAPPRKKANDPVLKTIGLKVLRAKHQCILHVLSFRATLLANDWLLNQDLSSTKTNI